MEEESNPTTKKEALAKFHGDVEQSDEESEETTSKKFSLNSKIFTTGRYCFDTPGVSNDDQQVSFFKILFWIVPETSNTSISNSKN